MATSGSGIARRTCRRHKCLSYLARPVRSVLADVEERKKGKYSKACAERRADFTPFVSSEDGALGREAKIFLRRLNKRISIKWQRNISDIAHWTRTRLLFAILRATSSCLRGSRTKWSSGDMLHGSALRLARTDFFKLSFLILFAYLQTDANEPYL